MTVYTYGSSFSKHQFECVCVGYTSLLLQACLVSKDHVTVWLDLNSPLPLFIFYWALYTADSGYIQKTYIAA